MPATRRKRASNNTDDNNSQFTTANSNNSRQPSKRVSFGNDNDNQSSSSIDVEVSDTNYTLDNDTRQRIRSTQSNTSNSGDLISATMNQQGPIVPIIILHADGTASNPSTDMTPRLDAVGRLLQGSGTFLGEIDCLHSVIVIRRDQDNTTLNVNQHKLPYPFNQDTEPVRGDILIIRMDNDAVPEPLRVEEYNEYVESVNKQQQEQNDNNDNEQDQSEPTNKRKRKTAAKSTATTKQTTAAVVKLKLNQRTKNKQLAL